jgi:nicotinamidase-related amidase
MAAVERVNGTGDGGKFSGQKEKFVERVFGLNVPGTLEEICDPRRMALLVYDMQAGIVSQLPNGPEVTGRVAEVLGAAREGGFPVFFSRHMSLPKELMGVFQLRQAMAWQRVERVEDVEPWFPRNSPQFQIVSELEPLASEAVSDKIAMSAFEGTFLNIALRDLGIVSFAICGIATEVGIEPTVRHGADLGYIPVVIADACGAGDEAAGRRALESLEFAGDSIITDSATISALFRKAATVERRRDVGADPSSR